MKNKPLRDAPNGLSEEDRMNRLLQLGWEVDALVEKLFLGQEEEEEDEEEE